MTQYGYALIGGTAIIVVLVAVLMFALMRFASAARDAKRHFRDNTMESALLSAALQEAVTKVKAQEKAMSDRAVASEELNSQIVGSLTAGLIVVDRRGAVEILNPAARRLLGIANEEPKGAVYRDLLASVPELADVIGECLRTMQPLVRRTVQVDTDDHVMHLGVTVSPLGGAEARGVICLFSDLTNVFELEEQLRLKDTLAQLGELTAGLAHEFRNGLATIHGYSRLIDPAMLPANYQPYIQGIREEADALGRVVTNFLNFARPDRISFSPVHLAPLVSGAIDDMRHDNPLAQIEARGEFGVVDGDEVLLRQMIANLIRNGLEASRADGKSPIVAIEGRTDPAERMCRFTVEDNGPGISPALRDRVFRPFFTTKAQGTGLGLAIVQKVVVTHNGKVTVGSSPLGGARFEVTFPMTAQS